MVNRSLFSIRIQDVDHLQPSEIRVEKTQRGGGGGDRTKEVQLVAFPMSTNVTRRAITFQERLWVHFYSDRIVCKRFTTHIVEGVF